MTIYRALRGRCPTHDTGSRFLYCTGLVGVELSLVTWTPGRGRCPRPRTPGSWRCGRLCCSVSSRAGRGPCRRCRPRWRTARARLSAPRRCIVRPRVAVCCQSWVLSFWIGSIGRGPGRRCHRSQPGQQRGVGSIAGSSWQSHESLTRHDAPVGRHQSRAGSRWLQPATCLQLMWAARRTSSFFIDPRLGRGRESLGLDGGDDLAFLGLPAVVAADDLLAGGLPASLVIAQMQLPAILTYVRRA